MMTEPELAVSKFWEAAGGMPNPSPVNQTRDEYMKLTKRELAEMLVNANEANDRLRRAPIERQRYIDEVHEAPWRRDSPEFR